MEAQGGVFLSVESRRGTSWDNEGMVHDGGPSEALLLYFVSSLIKVLSSFLLWTSHPSGLSFVSCLKHHPSVSLFLLPRLG